MLGRLALCLMWGAIGALLVAIGRQQYEAHFLGRSIRQTIEVQPDIPLTRKHPIYGRHPVAGEFEVSISVPEASAPYTFGMQIDDEGYRTTSPDPAVHDGRPEIWIFGCSFTWGYPLDNEDTYPWLLQRRLPGFRVRNFGVQGVGNVRALRQLRELLEEQRREPPVLAVFAYASFHKRRNLGGAVDDASATGLGPSHLLDYRELLSAEALDVPVPERIQGPAARHENQVTIALFREILALCRTHDIVPVLGMLTVNGRSDPVVMDARQQGFHVVDMGVDFRLAVHNLMPFDNHPNAEANIIYAQRLLGPIRAFLPEH